MDLFHGKYTLNRNFVLRKSLWGYSLYDIHKSMRTEISFQLYSVLRLFLHNCTNLTDLNKYFQSHDITMDLIQIQSIIKDREDLTNLLVASEQPLEKYDSYKKILQKDVLTYEYTPEAIDFLITTRCNLDCPHCYRNSTSTDKLNKIPTKRIFALLDEMEQLRIHTLKITGGEPFLVPELYDILSYASTKRIQVVVLTNATLPLKEKWNKIITSPNIALGVSLDGATALTHDIIRGQGSFDKTMNNLKIFSDLGVYFGLTFTVNTKNYNDLEQVILLAIKLKAKKLFVNFVDEIGRAVSSEGLFYGDTFNVSEIQDKVKLYADRFKDKIRIKVTDNHGLTFEEKMPMTEEQKNLIICSAGHSSFTIDSKLTVFPCMYGTGGKKEYPVGSLMENSIIDIWNSNKFNPFRGGLTINDLPKCSKCEHSDNCNLKFCRLRPVFEGRSLTDNVSFCRKELHT